MPLATSRPKNGVAASPKNGSFKPAELARYFRLKLAAEWGPHDLKRALEERREKIFILDVRHREGFRGGHIPGAKNIPFEELESRLKEIARETEVVTYCWNLTCSLSTQAAALLSSKGFQARELSGGVAQWQAAGFAIER